jgi:hypothetical protein
MMPPARLTATNRPLPSLMPAKAEKRQVTADRPRVSVGTAKTARHTTAKRQPAAFLDACKCKHEAGNSRQATAQYVT